VAPPAQIDPALASTLRRLREDRHHTQEDLAHHAGITVAALARIERGKANPTWTTVRSIATALNIKLSDLGTAIEQTKTQKPSARV
jgi:DNA-binding XRE family transcriptional regulator